MNLANIQLELTSYNPKTKGNHRREYNRQKQAQYRAKAKALKPSKPLSQFQKLKLHQLLKLLVNHRSFVPVAPKLKHPTKKNWNDPNYWYDKLINLNNLPRGCIRIYAEQWSGCFVIWLDIDQKGWTKLAKHFRCGYVKSPKGHIRIPIPVENLQGYKTGTLYFKNQKIGDAKLSGEVMLPGNSYYDKQGNFLGYYEYKAWGTFFPFNNRIWSNVEELFSFLQGKFSIEYKTMREHFLKQKNKQKVLIKELIPIYTQTFKEQLFNLSVKGPPWPERKIKESLLKIGN